jgi:hypothetical protein
MMAAHHFDCDVILIMNHLLVTLLSLWSHPQVWDRIFLGRPLPADCTLDPALLAAMKREFEYWYPWDLRVSGKVGWGVTWCDGSGMGVLPRCVAALPISTARHQTCSSSISLSLLHLLTAC